jgi:hypothetical protein
MADCKICPTPLTGFRSESGINRHHNRHYGAPGIQNKCYGKSDFHCAIRCVRGRTGLIANLTDVVVKPVFPAVREFSASWAERNRCTANPVESTVAPDVTRLEYPDCAEGAAVVLYTLLGGSHTWPGGKPLPEWWVGPTSGRPATATSRPLS